MSKSKRKFTDEYDFEDEFVSKSHSRDRQKQKRIDRALRTKNIDEFVELDDEGLDPIDFKYGDIE